jgi:hypothetical protein
VRWDIERYVKLYRRDTAEWSMVPWRARGLFDEMLRKADLDGSIECGRLQPAQAVAILVGAPPDDVPEIERLVALLLEDGCVRDVPAAGCRGRHLSIPNYRPAQGEPLTGAERQARWRAKQRGNSGQVDRSDEVTDPIHPSDPSEPADHVIGWDEHHRNVRPIRPAAAGRRRSPVSGLSEDTVAESFRRELSKRLIAEGLTDQELVLASRQRLGETIQTVVAAVSRCGLEACIDACAEHAEGIESRIESVAFFIRLLSHLEKAAPRRKSGDLPRPGDPDFNNPAAWGADYGAFLKRDTGRPPPYVVPVYKPPLTPEERAEQLAKAQGKRA